MKCAIQPEKLTEPSSQRGANQWISCCAVCLEKTTCAHLLFISHSEELLCLRFRESEFIKPYLVTWRTPKGSLKHSPCSRGCESNVASLLNKSECKSEPEYKVAPCYTELQDIPFTGWEQQCWWFFMPLDKASPRSLWFWRKSAAASLTELWEHAAKNLACRFQCCSSDFHDLQIQI